MKQSVDEGDRCNPHKVAGFLFTIEEIGRSSSSALGSIHFPLG